MWKSNQAVGNVPSNTKRSELIGLVLSNMTYVELLLLLLSLWLWGRAGIILGICLKSGTQWLLLIFVEGSKKSPQPFPNQI